MILYLDTSAVVPILITEPSSDVCRRIWEVAERRVTSRLTFVEVGAALAMAERHRRISASEHTTAWSNFAAIWPDFDVVEVTGSLTESAVVHARNLSLRGYDAMHCAAAAALNDSSVVAATGDVRLLEAWHTLELDVIDTRRA